MKVLVIAIAIASLFTVSFLLMKRRFNKTQQPKEVATDELETIEIPKSIPTPEPVEIKQEEVKKPQPVEKRKYTKKEIVYQVPTQKAVKKKPAPKKKA